MSELTNCNYCSWRRIQMQAKQGGYSVALIDNTAYRLPAGVPTTQFQKWSKQDKEPYFLAWFMELTNHCVC